jgi:hypothetical protein
MSFEALYADRMESALQRDLAAPPRPKDTGFATWSMLSAGAKGVPRGGLEVGASGFDAAGEAIRSVQDAFLMERDDPSQTLSQVAGRMDDRSALARAAAQGFAPPETAHQADQVMHNLVRVGAKAIAAMAAGGPVSGGMALAAEEGNTVYRDLIAKGIDPATALQVAGVTGVATGVSVGLPMAGATVKGTIGLVAAGGPGTYMAQEKLSQQILAKAGYHDEASLHNPTDPLGLALSTILPSLFGGASLAMRPRAPALVDVVKHLESRGKRYGKDGEILTSPKGAQGEMQVMPYTAKDPGFGVTPARDGSPDELARVGRDYLAAMEARYPGEPDKALAAYNAGPGAVDKAVAKAGAEWRTLMPDETRGYVAHGMNKLRDDAKAHVALDPEVVDAARTRVTNDALNRSMPDHMDARAEVMRAGDEIAAGRMPEVREMPTTALPEFREWFGDSKVVDEATGEPMVVYHGTQTPGFDSFKRGEVPPIGGVRFADAQGHYFTRDPGYASDYGETVMPVYLSIRKPYIVPPGEFDHTYVSATRRAELEAQGYDGIIAPEVPGTGYSGGRFGEMVAFRPEQIKSAIGNSGKFDPNSASLTDPLKPGERNPRRDTSNALPPPDRVTIEPEPVAAKGEAVVSPESQRLAKMAEESPDMKVTLPGHDKPMTLAEALETAKAEAAEEAKAATLVQAALECALSFGA